MIQPQRSKLLGDLYYDETPRAFVAPPVKELKELTKAREDDYLLAKQTQNDLESAMKVIPAGYSPQAYQQLTNKTRQVLSGLNADNYADNVMNVKQVAQDFKNKWGAEELLDEGKQIGERFSVFEEKAKKAEITPEMEKYYKNETLSQTTGVKFDASGNPIKSVVPTIAPVPTFKIAEDAIKVANDWKANVLQRTPEGKLIVNNDIGGYFSVGSTKEVTAEEVKNALHKYYEQHPDAQAYLKDYTDMKAKQYGDSPEALNAVLPQEIKDKLFGVKGANEFDIANAAAQGRIDIPSMLREAIKYNTIEESIAPAVAKESFKEETVNLVKDEMLFKALDQMTKIQEEAKKTPETNAVVTLVPEMSVAAVSKTNIKDIQTTKEDLKQRRAVAQDKVYKYQALLKSGAKGASVETLALLNKDVQEVDESIERTIQQEKAIVKSYTGMGKEIGVDFDKIYKDDFHENRNEAIKRNTENYIRKVDLDVTKYIVMRERKTYLKIDNKEIDVTSQTKPKNNKIYISGDAAVAGAGQTYVALKKILPNYFDTYGKFDQTKIKINDSSISPESFNKEQVKVPNKEQQRNLALKAYINDITPSLSSDFYTDKETNYIVKNTVLQGANKISNRKGNTPLNIEQPLTSIMVTGETNKEALKILVNKNKALSTTFKKSPNMFEIQHDGKNKSVSNYLQEVYGINGLDATDIDMAKSDARYATTSDRNKGQDIILDLHLTPKALKEASDELKQAAAQGSIKLLVHNPRANQESEKRAMSSTILQAFQSIQDNNSPLALDTANEMGAVYMDNINEGRVFSDLNLYTRRTGDNAKFNIRGEEYGVMTTTKSGESSSADLMNVNFHLTRIKDNKEEVQAINQSTGERAWRPLAGIEKDTTWDKVYYATPDDMKKTIGASLLLADAKSQSGGTTQGATQFNPYLQYINTSRGPQYNTSAARTNVKTSKAVYNKVNMITIGGQTFNSRVPAKDLTTMPEIADRIQGAKFAIINKAVKPYVVNMVLENNLNITGLLRDNESSNAPGGAEDSLHKVGAGVDLKLEPSSDAFIERALKDPLIMRKYGITSILKEADHYHLEFKLF